MTLKGDVKFKRKLTRSLKNYIRNSVNFHEGSQKSKILDENVQKSYASWHWTVTPSVTLGSKNGIRNLLNFNASSDKSENLHFDVLLLLKTQYVWGKKVESSYVS